jgi:hypothetical protein
MAPSQNLFGEEITGTKATTPRGPHGKTTNVVHKEIGAGAAQAVQ